MQGKNTRLITIITFLSMGFLMSRLHAEGTKQLSPTSTDLVNLNLCSTGYNSFGRYDGLDNQRLYIHIKDPSTEQVFLGFSQPRTSAAYPCTTGNTTAYFRIKNAAGTVVFPTVGNANGQAITANITGWATAAAGPSQIVGASGYTATVFNPAGLGAGDYYVEFSKTQGAYSSTAFALEWWDITVATKTATPTAINGRVFSKNWAFYTPSINCSAAAATCTSANQFGAYDRAFNGAFHIYSPTDSVVTKVDFKNSGLQPIAFNLFFNDRGPGTSGNIVADRKSVVNALVGTSLYPLFLNDPDATDYPSGSVGQYGNDLFMVSCDAKTAKFFVTVTKAGQIDVLIDLDKTTPFKYDKGTRDVVVALKVVPALGEVPPYKRTIPWDGKDGFGVQVNLAAPIDYAVNYGQGIFHLPIYDAEFMTVGFNFSAVRPIPPLAAKAVNVYYDDTNIVDTAYNTNTKLQLNGCVAPCHKWNNYCYGNNNTINTWFFGSEETKTRTAVFAVCFVDAVNDAATVTTPSVALSVLSNDLGSSIDSASLSTVGLAQPLHGTIAVNVATRKITYTPTIAYVGKDSFQYRICDTGNYTCDTAWVILTMPSVGGFTFNCGTAATTGTFTANSTAGQTGTLTVPMTGATAGTVTLNVTGTGFTGTLTTTLTAGQTSVVIPITYDGTGVNGSRTLTVTSSAGVGTCTKAVSVVCPTIAAATATIVQPTCSVATGTLTVTSPSSGVTYSFDNGTTYQASATSNALTAGTYNIITKTTSSNCLSTAVSKTVNAQPATPSVPTLSVTQPTCSGATGSITVTSPSSGVTYSFNNGASYQAGATLSGLTAATYAVIVKDNTSSCTSTAASATINAPLNVPSVPTLSTTQPTCATATGTITVTSPSSGVTYSFNNGTTYQAGAMSSALTAGTYQIIVKSNASSCTTAAASSTLINAQPTTPSVPTLTLTQPTCSVSTGTITVNTPTGSGMTYSIDGLDYSNTSGIFNNVAPNTYNVTAKSSTGCVSGSTSATINPSVPTPTVSLTQPTCAVATGGSIVTSPTGSGLTYSLDGVDYSNTSGQFSNLMPNTYTVTVRNTSGCTSAGTTFTINPPVQTPIVSIIQPTCATATGTITVTTPSSGVTYSFDNGATYQAANVLSGLISRVYQIIAKDITYGCTSATTSATINAQPVTPSVPTVSVSQPTCSVATGTITVTSPSSGVTYSFDNGATYQAAATLSGLATGVHEVIVKGNASNCASSATSVTIDAQPATPSVPTTSVTEPTCSVATGTITVTSPSSGVTYSFDNGTTYQAAATLSGLATGVHQVVVKNNVGACVSSAQSTTIAAQPNVPTTPVTSVTEPTCSVATGTITVTSPSSGVTYSFDNGVTYQAANVSVPLTAGIYQVIVKDDVSMCSSSANATTVNAQPVTPSLPTFSVTQPTCATATGTITVTSPSSGVTYSFDNGTTYQTTATSSALPSGNHDIKVKKAVGGCTSATATAIIDAQPTPPSVPTTTVTEPTCATATGTISVTNPSSGVTYSFDNGATFQASATSNDLSAGVHQVVVKDDVNGCVSVANGTTISPQPNIPTTPVATVTHPTCGTTTGTITVTSPSSGVSYSFDDGITFQTLATSSPLPTGIYQVVAKDDASTCVSNPLATGINAPPATPSVPTTSVSQPTCSVATGTITVTNPSSGVTYSFDNGTTFQTGATSNALPSGIHQVVMKDTTSNCVSMANATTINPQPVTPTTPIFTYVAANCTAATGSITITAPVATGMTYSVNGSNYSNTTGSFTGLSVGSYAVSAKSSAGCLSPSVSVTFTPWMSFNIKLMLEGCYQTATGLMQTTLNQRGLLPGQTPIGAFAVATPKGQPFKNAPWSYAGTEGDTVTTYPATVVDWVLVSLKTDSTSSINVFRTSGWLHSDGHVSFITPCFNIADGSYFVLVEHRNHVGVLSPTKVTATNRLITQDFTTADSYIRVNPPSTGEKLKSTKWVMMAGDGKNDTPNTNYDVNFNDIQLWKGQSGIFDQYRLGDFNMDADINFSDSFLWKLNSGKYSGVPH